MPLPSDLIDTPGLQNWDSPKSAIFIVSNEASFSLQKCYDERSVNICTYGSADNSYSDRGLQKKLKELHSSCSLLCHFICYYVLVLIFAAYLNFMSDRTVQVSTYRRFSSLRSL